ncbi:hemoglobin subunit beta-like [Schistocerca americana]|uniref:hemoglobin subunit beta-like n=1 Tax=Schistocerca americana TaxID=7009 RepID=UPI001F4F7991|nr:hemoglobin subunit beta-like [Schistocerca americana]
MGASQSMEQYLDRPSTETGLRRREMKALIACWAVIEQDLRDQSIKLFVRLMRKHPEYRRYFRTLASSSPRVLSSIAADARVQTHFRNILTSVGSLVYTSVNKPDNLVPKYDFLALVHRHIGLGLQDFFNFRDELIDYFKSEFPSQMTPLCVGAWHTLLTRAFTEICLRIDEYHRTAPREGTHKRQAEEDAQDGESAVSCKRGENYSLGFYNV